MREDVSRAFKIAISLRARWVGWIGSASDWALRGRPTFDQSPVGTRSNPMKRITKWIGLAMLPCFGSCAMLNVFATDPAMAGPRKDGTFRDSASLRESLTDSYSAYAGMELRKEKPPGGGTWTNHWALIFKALKNRENHDFYINYIVTERQKRGLPKLPASIF